MLQQDKAPRIYRHEGGKVVSPTHQEISLVLISIRGWVDRITSRRIKSMRNLYDPVGNRTRDLSACSAVP